MNLLHDVIGGNGSAGILETMAAMIPGCGREQGAIGSQDVEAQKPQLFNQRNQGMKDLLIQGLSDANTKVGESGLTGDAVLTNACQTAIALSSFGIVKNQAEVLDGSDSIEIAEQIEKENRDGIVAGTAEDGIGDCGNRADERKIDNRGNQLRDAATNGTIVVDMDKFLAKFVMRKPTGLFLGKWFTVPSVDKRIDFPELSDNIANCEPNEFVHLKDPGVSREVLPPSKTLPGNPFLLVNANHSTFPDHIQTNASDSSLSTNTGGTALRSFSCT
jgi:hypothetical protein